MFFERVPTCFVLRNFRSLSLSGRKFQKIRVLSQGSFIIRNAGAAEIGLFAL